jgi:hypothetical protein
MEEKELRALLFNALRRYEYYFYKKGVAYEDARNRTVEDMMNEVESERSPEREG